MRVDPDTTSGRWLRHVRRHARQRLSRAARVVVPVLCAGLGLQCADATGPRACSGPVTVEVGAGLTPRISWSPGCRAADLLIDSPAPGGATYWRVTDPVARNTLHSPQTYGVIPPDEFSPGLPVALVAGVQYRATLSLGDSAGHLVEIGSALFTP